MQLLTLLFTLILQPLQRQLFIFMALMSFCAIWLDFNESRKLLLLLLLFMLLAQESVERNCRQGKCVCFAYHVGSGVI